MKIKNLLMGVGLLTVSLAAMPSWAENFRPERGVRCDDAAEVCYERGEPSPEMTARYFGDRSARRLGRDLRRQDRGDAGRNFYPERGIRCNRIEQVCYDRHGDPSAALTGQYLGSAAARRVGRQYGNDYNSWDGRRSWEGRGWDAYQSR